MSYISLARLREDVAWVAHTQRILTSLESVFSSITDAVSAQRGYAIGGTADFLATYRRAIQGAREDIRLLTDLVRDDPEQADRLKELARLVDEREKFTDKVTEFRRSGRIAEAQALISQGGGNAIHEQIRMVVDAMQDAEQALLERRQAQASRADLVARSAIVLGNVLALLVAVAAMLFVSRDYSRGRRANALREGKIDSLEVEVRERTAEAGEAHREAAAGEAHLRGIVQSAMDAIVTVDEQQNIVIFNAAAEAIFGCSEREALGASLDRFIPERFRAAHRAHIERFGETRVTTREMGGQLALYGLRSNGEEFPIDASISQIATGGKRYYTVILRDVTVRKKAENELRKANHEWRAAHEQLTAIIQSAMDAVITVDADQRIVLFNYAAEKMFRCKAQTAIGGLLDRFIPERFRAAHRRHVERFGETRVTTRMMGANLSLSGVRADGEEFPVDASISQVTVDGEKLYTVILRDVTERKRAQDDLERSHREFRELAAAMHAVREAERTRVARELHDELAQWLTALKMDASWLGSRLPAGETVLRDRTQRMKVAVDTAVTAVRRIAADLRPVMLDDLGLVPAIESLLHDLSQRTGIIVSLVSDAVAMELGEPVATSVYRMVQEAITNVARHAEATQVEVRLEHEEGALMVRVRDNGKGYDVEAAARRKSHGVLGIMERAHTLGGRASLARQQGGGTLVEISVPMDRFRGAESGNDPGTAR